MTAKFSSGRKAAEQFATACNSIKTHAEEAGKGAAKGASGLSKFGSSIVRIAKYRAIRAVIRNIMEAFSEGLQNVREYSAGLTGEGRRIANAFDSMSNHSLKMKNQLGSAFAEILTSLMPVIEKIIAWITRAADAISQFFAALGGNSRYYKAVDVSSQVEKNLSGGASAAKEIRNQLMGFDEINRLDKPNEPSGGGGGVTSGGANKMFEYTELDKWTEKIAKIRDRLVELWDNIKTAFMKAWTYIKDHFDFEQTFDDVCDIIEGAVEFVSGLLSGDWAMAFAGAAKVVQGLGNIVINVLSFIQGIGDSFFNWLTSGINSAFDWLEQKTGISFSLLRNAFLGVVTSVKQLWDGLFNAVKQVLQGIVSFIAGIFTGNLRGALQGIVSIVKGVLNAAVTVVERGINAVINAINFFLGAAQGVIKALGGVSWLHIQPVSLPRFATGGFPEDGLFFANHGEMVGQFSNGQTAVANNEQIVEGIKRGVFEAMSSAMSVGGNGQSHTTEININGRQFFRAVWDDYKAVAREHGVKLVNNV